MYFFISHTLVQGLHRSKKGAGAEARPIAGMFLPGIRLSARPWLFRKVLLPEILHYYQNGSACTIISKFSKFFLTFYIIPLFQPFFFSPLRG